MKKARVLLPVIVLMTIALAAGSLSAFVPREELRSANVAQVREGYRASKLIGRAVLNDAGERVGTVTDLVIDRDYALFAVLDVGTFLAIDDHKVTVPIRTLVLEQESNLKLPGATRKALRNFPEFRFPN
jgi:sporulation protein YlmC with PRC-barrel domain